MPYTDANAIAAYLGVALTASQQTQAGVLADAVTTWIDNFTGASWRVASPATETHEVTGDTVYLNRRPVTAVTSVQTRADVVGAAWTTLAVGQYELIDAANGQLQLIGWGNFLARVVYTHTAADAPADVRLAAAVLAAGWMTATLRPNTQGLKSLAVGQNDIVMSFADQTVAAPPEVLSILRAYRRFVVA